MRLVSAQTVRRHGSLLLVSPVVALTRTQASLAPVRSPLATYFCRSQRQTHTFFLFSAATLIEAATAAELIMSDPEGGGVFDDKCAINGDEADCTLLFVSGTVTITSDLETESAVPFEVQVGASAAATGAASSAPNTASAGSAPASGASQTQSASQTGASTSETGSSTSQAVSVTQSGSTSTSASATPSGNGVAKLGWSGAATLLSGAGVAMMLFV